MKAGEIIIDTKLKTKDFTKQIEDLENNIDGLKEQTEALESTNIAGENNELIKQYNIEIEKATNKLAGLYKQQAKINGQNGWGKIKDQIEDSGKSLTKLIKKVGKMALAVFGIRSAYLGVRSAMSTISEYDDQLKADVDYMKYALAMVLKPVIEWIINAVKSLMYYVGYIAKAWFGIDLWANSSAKGMNKASKSAEKLKNNLAGFDELNVLSTSEDTSGGGVEAPSFDLSEMDMEPPAWLQWIVDNKDIVLGFFETLLVLMTALKITEFLSKFGTLAELGLNFGVAFGGLTLIIGGLALAIKGVVDFIKDPSWHNFLTILEGIALVVAGIAVLMGGWVVALVALGVAIIAYLIQNWDKVKEILGKVGSWIYEHIIQPVIEFFKSLWESIKEIFSPIIDFFANIFSTCWENLKIIIENVKEIFRAVGKFISDVFGPVFEGIVKGFKTAFESVKSIFKMVVDYFKGLIDTIFGFFKMIGTKVGDIIAGAFKAVVNGILNAIENILNFPIKAVNKLISTINKIPGISLNKLNTFDLPRLATGGIVTQPTMALMGENNKKEAVLPLERNTEWMDALADKISQRNSGNTGNTVININANGTLGQLIRLLKLELDKENSRVGTTLIVGGTN